jgi:hypothetical protein
LRPFSWHQRQSGSAPATNKTAHGARPTLGNCLSATHEAFALDGRAKDKRASVSMVVMERRRFDRHTARVQQRRGFEKRLKHSVLKANV